MNLISVLGDFICAFQSSGTADKLLGRSLNEGVVNTAGLVSALAVLYSIDPKK